MIEYSFSILSFSNEINLFLCSSLSTEVFTFFLLFTLRKIIPPAVIIGFENSPISKSLIARKIFFDIWFSLIQPISPPNFELSDILWITAESLNPIVWIDVIISSDFFSISFLFFSKKIISDKLKLKISELLFIIFLKHYLFYLSLLLQNFYTYQK